MAHQHVNQKIVHRLSRIEGHLHSIKEMVASGRDCAEVLVQMAAVRAALDRAGCAILEDHLEHCIAEAAEAGKGQQAIDELKMALKRFIG
jgi:DNA-binding FrmR family transcriptional regulator